MISEPERYIDEFVTAGADLVTVHVETCPHLHAPCNKSVRPAPARR
jgi:pentose-5-phosphate-3-epimerase